LPVIVGQFEKPNCKSLGPTRMVPVKALVNVKSDMSRNSGTLTLLMSKKLYREPPTIKEAMKCVCMIFVIVTSGCGS
jgi:hypothetical protein